MTNRRVIDTLPPERRGNDPYGWVKAAEDARKLHSENPEAWIVAAEHVPVVKISALRQYSTEPFRTDEGRVDVRYRNSKVGDDGVRYADCYMRWVPKEKH